MDELDNRIFEVLRRNGRASMEEISRIIGLSRVATRSRVLKLFESGIIRVTSIVHPASQGLSAFAHLTISVAGPARETATQLATLEEVLLVSIVAGHAAIIAEVNTADAQEAARDYWNDCHIAPCNGRKHVDLHRARQGPLRAH